MKIFVTGAAGFVAGHLIPELQDLGHKVIGCDKKKAKRISADEYIQCDLIDGESYKDQLKNIDCIMHLAALRSDWGVSVSELMQNNFQATETLIEVGVKSGVKSWVFVSSVSAMPQSSSGLLDDDALYSPINDYGRSKMLAEKALIQMQRENPELNVTIVRPTVLYGTSSTDTTSLSRIVDNNIFRLIDGIHSGRFAIVGDGTTIKTTAYIKNFVSALIFLLPSRPGCEVFVYADYPPLSNQDLVQIIRNRLGKKGLGPKIPLFLALPISVFGDLITRVTGVNFPITRARVETFNRSTHFIPKKLMDMGFTFKYSTKKALEETVDWYLKLKNDYGRDFLLFSEDETSQD